MAYTVKQLAAMSGVTVRTLHFYNEMELLKPAYSKANGYRIYATANSLLLGIGLRAEADQGNPEPATVRKTRRSQVALESVEGAFRARNFRSASFISSPIRIPRNSNAGRRIKAGGTAVNGKL